MTDLRFFLKKRLVELMRRLVRKRALRLPPRFRFLRSKPNKFGLIRRGRRILARRTGLARRLRELFKRRRRTGFRSTSCFTDLTFKSQHGDHQRKNILLTITATIKLPFQQYRVLITSMISCPLCKMHLRFSHTIFNGDPATLVFVCDADRIILQVHSTKENLHKIYPLCKKQRFLCSFYLDALAQRVAAAFFAICFRFLADNFSARAFPPLLAPSLPSATATAMQSCRNSRRSSSKRFLKPNQSRVR